MKLAFLCEGYSEHDSIDVLLKRHNIFNYRYIRQYHDTTSLGDDTCYIYRHNYKNIGRIQSEYLEFSKLLIDQYGFSKIFVWYDNGGKVPVCEYARAQHELINSYKDRIELMLSVKCLENWYFSNVDILNSLLGQMVDVNFLESKNIRNFLNERNVDVLNIHQILAKIRKNSDIDHLTKQKTACRFFSLLDITQQYKSDSFARFLRRFRCIGAT